MLKSTVVREVAMVDGVVVDLYRVIVSCLVDGRWGVVDQTNLFDRRADAVVGGTELLRLYNEQRESE